jgi:uncharacterized protein YegL
MKDEKLRFAQECILQLSSALSDDDHLGIVTYGEEAHTLCPLMAQNLKGKHSIHKAVEKIAVESLSNLSDGIQTSLNEFNVNKVGFQFPAVVIITPGTPNHGLKR